MRPPALSALFKVGSENDYMYYAGNRGIHKILKQWSCLCLTSFSRANIATGVREHTSPLRLGEKRSERSTSREERRQTKAKNRETQAQPVDGACNMYLGHGFSYPACMSSPRLYEFQCHNKSYVLMRSRCLQHYFMVAQSEEQTLLCFIQWTRGDVIYVSGSQILISGCITMPMTL